MLNNRWNLRITPARAGVGQRRRGGRGAVVTLAVAVLVATGLGPMGALASHAEASLPGSNFEIDIDANLKVDDAGALDWANVSELRRDDEPTGKDDDSYAGGAKEDDPCPSTTTGSIPNNKSDLLTFGAYQETEAGGPGFLHLFWTRVQEPSGTTLMDFELNQSSTPCSNGVNKLRTAGDLLLEYRIEQGGATAIVKVREWTGTVWGPAEDLTAVSLATGTINDSSIPFSESDGLITSGSLSPRTFGEMSLDLDFVFDEDRCESFASGFLKSRASDAFTSQLKDFIKPVDLTISNCGKVVIRKQTNPDEDPNSTEFGFTKAFATDPATANTFTLKDDGAVTFANVLFGPGSVVEDVVPAGWSLQDIDCGASTGVTPSTDEATATVLFEIDSASDVVDCTYTNRALSGAILITKTRKHAADGPGDHPHAGVEFIVDGVTKSTGADGKVCFDGLALASYTVQEVTPNGYQAQPGQTVTVDNDAGCSDTPYGGETVSFSNIPLSDITVSFTSQVPGGTAATISCTSLTATPADQTPDAFDDTSETFKDLLPGTYDCTVVVDP